MESLLSVAVFVTAAQALAFDGKLPKPTLASIPDPTFQFPKVTIAPAIHELAKRQDAQTVLVGPDNTCGYFDGRPGAVYSCNGPDVTCALVTAAASGAVACCDGTDCGLRVACIDYRQFKSMSLCDMGCVQDTYTVKCTKSSAPFCGTVSFFSGIVDYYCDDVSYSTPQKLYTTYSGETDGRTFTPVEVTLDSSTSPIFPSSTSSIDDIGDNIGSSSSISPGPTPPTNGDDSSQSSSSSSGSTANVGAIAGGVVGGVAGLALIGLGIFFLLRHQMKKKRDLAAAQQGVPPMQHDPNNPAGAGYPYNPHLSQQYPQSPPAGYPQQGYYADPTKPGGFASVSPSQLPDRNSSTSPASQFTDNRQSVQPTSPTSTVNSNWQQSQQQPGSVPYVGPNVPPTVHEAGGNAVGERDYNANHHGQLHEMG